MLRLSFNLCSLTLLIIDYEGNFRATWINMWYDKLTAFPREVFESMLEDMIYAGGSIDLYGSNIHIT